MFQYYDHHQWRCGDQAPGQCLLGIHTLMNAWVLDRLMRHAQVCLGEIPLRLKMRKAHSADVMQLETHQRDASAANRALELLGREVNLFTAKKEVGKPGDFDHMADEELTEFIEAQGELVRELERRLLPHQPRSSARVPPSTSKLPLWQ